MFSFSYGEVLAGDLDSQQGENAGREALAGNLDSRQGENVELETSAVVR